MLEVLSLLAHADDMDIIEYARELMTRAQAPVDLVRAQLDAEKAESADYMAASAMRQIELRNKRALSAKSIETLSQLTAIVRSWLRDVMMTCAGMPELIINTDVASSINEAAEQAEEPRVVAALACVDETDISIRYNVSPETCVDVMLFTIREELYGSRSAR